VDGSYVIAKAEPQDVDSVLFLPENFADLLAQGVQAAVVLEEMFLTRQPEELFPAEDEAVWLGWCVTAPPPQDPSVANRVPSCG
jgi:hypothetical protein